MRQSMAVRVAPRLAELPEADAIRQRYDARNAAVLVWLLRLAALMALFIASGVVRLLLVGGIVLLLLVFTRMRGMDRGVPARWFGALEPVAVRIAPWRRGLTLVLFLAFYVAVVFHETGMNAQVEEENMTPWIPLFPMFALPLLLFASERILLHGSFVLATLVHTVLRSSADPSEVLTVSCFMNGVFCAVGLAMNRGYRKGFLSTWSDARGHYLERRRLEGELGYAREIQLSMLPKASPSLPWLDVAAFSLPAMQVGGDYYDYVLLDGDGGAAPTRVVIVLADVAGHGLASALMVSGLRSAVKLLAPELADGPRAMLRLTAMVRETAHRHMKVALSLALLDGPAGTITLTSAGQAPALVWRRATGRTELVELPALPLGSRLQERYPSVRIAVAPGDLIVMSTDGACDMLNPADELYGLERLVRLVEERGPWEGPAPLREAILTDLWAFKGTRAQDDDVTILVIGLRAPIVP